MSSQHQNPKSDIDISQAATMTPIIALPRKRLGIAAKDLVPYGHYKAKVSMDYIKSLKNKPNGKLILVSAMTPTTAGEGKTTTTVGLTDALNAIGKKAMICLREPSLGPSFGMKGGAAGGGDAGRAEGGGKRGWVRPARAAARPVVRQEGRRGRRRLRASRADGRHQPALHR